MARRPYFLAFADLKLYIKGTLENIEGRYDLLLMNLFARVILLLLPQIATRLNREGIAVLSGIMNDEADQVQRALDAEGFQTLERLTREEWTAFVVGCL